jgi:DNA-binding transcriptional LysR family regulator
MIIMAEWNDADFRLSDLRVLSVVLRERSLTRAAEVLDTTQPSISKVLTRLRVQFGDPLLVRNGQAMNPTAKALEITGPLRGLLVAADILRVATPSFDPRSSDRVFKLLVSDVGMVRFLPPLMSRIADQAPRLRLDAVPLDSRHFEAKLEAGEADLALGAFSKVSPGLRRQRLYVDGYLSVVRKQHPRSGALQTRSAFRSARHIIVVASDTGHAAHRMVQQAVEAEIAAENILLRLPSFIAAALIASRTDGVATIPANLATVLAAQLDLVTFQPPLRLPPIEIAQYWHERYQRDPGHRWMRSACFELFGPSRRNS